MVWSFSHKEAGSHWNGSKGWQQTPAVDFIMSPRYACGIDFKERQTLRHVHQIFAQQQCLRIIHCCFCDLVIYPLFTNSLTRVKWFSVRKTDTVTIRPGACFLKVPGTLRALKASCRTAIHLFRNGILSTCFYEKKPKRMIGKFDGLHADLNKHHKVSPRLSRKLHYHFYQEMRKIKAIKCPLNSSP